MRQPNSIESVSGGIVKQKFIDSLCPDRCQPNRPGPMQQKLHPAATTALLNLQFRHRKLILQKILATTKLHMHKVPQLLKCSNL